MQQFETNKLFILPVTEVTELQKYNLLNQIYKFNQSRMQLLRTNY